MNYCLTGPRSVAGAMLSIILGASSLFLPGLVGQETELNWQPGPGCRWSDLPVPKTGRTAFTLLTGTGIQFANLLADEHSLTNRNLLSGSGVAAGDVDGDGLVDLYFCGLDNNNVLYRNLGAWKFEDITA